MGRLFSRGSCVLLGAAWLLTPTALPKALGIKLPNRGVGSRGAYFRDCQRSGSLGQRTGPYPLWLQVHGLDSQSDAQVQVNGGAALPLE